MSTQQITKRIGPLLARCSLEKLKTAHFALLEFERMLIDAYLRRIGAAAVSAELASLSPITDLCSLESVIGLLEDHPESRDRVSTRELAASAVGYSSKQMLVPRVLELAEHLVRIAKNPRLRELDVCCVVRGTLRSGVPLSS